VVDGSVKEPEPRNRMREIFKSGSVGGAPGNRCFYLEADADPPPLMRNRFKTMYDTKKYLGVDLKQPYKLMPHNPIWKEIFQNEATKINEKISTWVVDIQHFGSTAVPGLMSKPIIDIIIGIENLNDWVYIKEPIEDLGYIYDKNAHAPHPVFFKPEIREFHLHINQINSLEWDRNIGFRDLLISDSNMRKEYEQVKFKASLAYPNDYTVLKRPIIHEMLQRIATT
jgi:GrpB-like predicted nucleotidyltransferase (UPF0157 family)